MLGTILIIFQYYILYVVKDAKQDFASNFKFGIDLDLYFKRKNN